MIHPGVAFWAPAVSLTPPDSALAGRDGIGILVQWVHAGGGGVVAYRVYRRVRLPEGPWSAWGWWRDVAPPSLQTRDATALADHEYQYRIHSWDGATESAGVETNVVGAVAPIQWQVGYPVDYGPDDVSIVWGFNHAVDSSALQVWRRIGSSMGGDPTATGSLIYEGILTTGTTNLGAPGAVGYIVARARYGSPGSYEYGPWSEERSATAIARLPGTPTGVTLAVLTATSVRLTWTPGAPTTQTGWDVQYRTRAHEAAPWSGWADTGDVVTSSPYDFTAATEGAQNQLRIRAKNTSGASAWAESNVVCPSVPVSIPTIISVSPHPTSDPTSRLRITYSAPSGLIVEIRYRFSAGPGPWQTDQGPDVNGSPFDLVGLADGVQYDIQLRTTNACGAASAWSSIAQGTTVAAVPDPPVLIDVAPTGDDRLTVSWTPPLDAVDYDLQRAPDVGGSPGTWATIASGHSSASYLDTGLAANTRYHYRVRANNSGGAGDYSTPMAGTTLLDRPAALDPVHVWLSCPSIEVEITWSNENSAGVPRNETMTLQRSNNSGGSWTTVSSSIPAGTTSYTDHGATEQVTDRYRLRYNSEAAWAEESISILCPL